MKKVKITAIRKTCYPDLMAKYENPIQHACDVEEGQVWIANGWEKPEGFCDSAWESMSACPYCRYAENLGCPELMPVFCDSDFATYGNLPGIKFERTQTLGTGGSYCDFRFTRE